MFTDFREGGRETLISCLLYALWPGMEPTIQACALTVDRAHNL